MNTQYPPPAPSLKTLVIATLVATLLAAAIFWIIVLPAEYGLDPTGFGKKSGLLQLAATKPPEIKPAVITCPTAPDKPAASAWRDSVVISVPAQSGLEYKFFLKKGARLEYQWQTNGAKLYFDFHGEPKGDNTGYFKSFQEDTRNGASGDLIAPFTGKHGWYWENKTHKPVTVTLKTRGDYKVLGLM